MLAYKFKRGTKLLLTINNTKFGKICFATSGSVMNFGHFIRNYTILNANYFWFKPEDTFVLPIIFMIKSCGKSLFFS